MFFIKIVFTLGLVQDNLNKERAWNNLNNYDAEFLFLAQRSQEEHSWST